MIDLHTHTLFSDGELLPAELIRRAEVTGYRAIALTDHVDQSNAGFVVPRLREVCDALREETSLGLIAGAEVTHVPPRQIAGLIEECRRLGAELVVVHGETIVEPVLEGTNAAAIEAGADILAHPGLLTIELAQKAAERGVCLELSSRRGHCLSNGLVARVAMETGAKLLVNTDSHAPGDLISTEMALRVARAAGLDEAAAGAAVKNAEELVARVQAPRG